MPGPYPVRKAKALADTDGAVTGDGPGTENAVPVQGMNQVALLVDGKLSATGTPVLDIYMETSINGTDYYRQTYLSDAATSTVSKKTYQIPNAQFTVTPFADDRFAVAVPVLAAFARFTFENTGSSSNFTNVACRALTGRV